MRAFYISLFLLLFLGCGDREDDFGRGAAQKSDFVFEPGNFNPDSIPEIRRLVDAAEAGDPDAQYYVAYLRDFTVGNYEPAIREFKRLAARGHLDSIEMLSFVYRSGKGTDVDYDEAAQWLERAAALGSVTAARDLANYRKYKARQATN